jgi:hypothetical protein
MLQLIALVMAVGEPVVAACSKDTDCKGDRICDEGRCMAPTPYTGGAPLAASPPPVPPVELALQPPSLEATDSIRFVADFSVGGGVAAPFGVHPSLAVFGAVGVTGSAGVGGVLAIDANFAFGPGGQLVTVALVPGLRLGGRSHLDLCVGPALLGVTGSPGANLLVAAIGQGHIELVGPLALQLSLSVVFNAYGFMLFPAVGLGVSMF